MIEMNAESLLNNASVITNLYVISDVGQVLMTESLTLVNPVAGVHEYVTIPFAPEICAEICVQFPVHIVVSGHCKVSCNDCENDEKLNKNNPVSKIKSVLERTRIKFSVFIFDGIPIQRQHTDNAR